MSHNYSSIPGDNRRKKKCPHLMQRLGTKAPEVPDHVWVLQVRLRVSLLAVDEGWKLNRK